MILDGGAKGPPTQHHPGRPVDGPMASNFKATHTCRVSRQDDSTS